MNRGSASSQVVSPILTCELKLQPSPAPRPPASAPAPELAVVVVNYESGDYLRACIGTLREAVGGHPVEVLVIDNASGDGSLAGIEAVDREARVIQNLDNVGYGRACTQAVAATTSPFVCFLNPDVLPRPGSLAELLKAAADRPDVGAIGPRILNPDGSLQPSCRVVPSFGVAVGHALFGLLRPSNRFTRAYMLLDWDHSSEREVDWVSGAAMLVRREAFEQIGGFDERFFMYVEDLDLCDRMRQAGWKVVYHPGAEVVHDVGGSSRRLPYRMIAHHHLSALRYARLKSRRSPRALLLPLVAAGLAARMAASWIDFFLRERRRGTSPPAPRGWE